MPSIFSRTYFYPACGSLAWLLIYISWILSFGFASKENCVRCGRRPNYTQFLGRKKCIALKRHPNS